MTETASAIIDPCIACLPVDEQRAAEVSLLQRLGGSFTATDVTEATVSVGADNVVLLAAAAAGVRYRDILIQNLGTVPVAFRLASTAAAAGGNGEKFLKACTVANDGNGGWYEVSGYLGQITAAAGSAANVSVTVLKIQ